MDGKKIFLGYLPMMEIGIANQMLQNNLRPAVGVGIDTSNWLGKLLAWN